MWLIVFGGYPNIADTTIIELSECSYTYVIFKANFSVSYCIYLIVFSMQPKPGVTIGE